MSVKLDVCEFTLTHTSIEMAEAWYEEPKRRVGTTTINDQVFASCSTISNGKWSTKRDSWVIDGSFAGAYVMQILVSFDTSDVYFVMFDPSVDTGVVTTASLIGMAYRPCDELATKVRCCMSGS